LTIQKTLIGNITSPKKIEVKEITKVVFNLEIPNSSIVLKRHSNELISFVARMKYDDKSNHYTLASKGKYLEYTDVQGREYV